MIENPEMIRDIPFFSELSTDELRKFMKISKLMNFKKGDIIFLEGDVYYGFYIVVKGAVRVYKSNPDGREITLHIIEPFNSFAEIPMFISDREEGNIYPANAQAIENSVLIFIPKVEFLRIINENSKICLKMLHGFAERLMSLNQQIENLTLKDVVTRLAEYLYNKYKNSGKNEINLNLSRSMLATYLGTISETISRALRKLQDEDLIEIQGKKIIIKKPEKLKQICG